jgi:hypothetical protein
MIFGVLYSGRANGVFLVRMRHRAVNGDDGCGRRAWGQRRGTCLMDGPTLSCYRRCGCPEFQRHRLPLSLSWQHNDNGGNFSRR